MAEVQKATPPRRQTGSGVNWLIAGALAVCVVQFASSLSPSVWTWGIDYWTEFPAGARLVLFALVIAAAIPGVRDRIAARSDRIRWPNHTSWALALVAFAAFVFFRSRGLAYGDGYSIRALIVNGAFPSVSGNLALMSGDLAVHWAVYRTAVAPLGGSIEFAYTLLSALAGAASLFAISVLAAALFPNNRRARWALVAAGFSSGMAALWFGHVEAYSLVAATLLWSLALLCTDRRGWGWLLWVAACFLHLLAIAFFPVLIWASWGRTAVGQMTKSRTALALVGGFVFWGIAGAVISTVRPGIFVPILASPETSYTAFSFAHFSDCLNLILFAAPLGLVGLTLWLAADRPAQSGRSTEILSNLTVAAASLWYFAFWIDPLLGGFRDWDLLGMFGIPLSLLGVAVLLVRDRSEAHTRGAWVVVAAFALAHTGAFVASVQSETRVIERVDRLVREDEHYTRGFHLGERRVSWAYILTHVVDMKEKAIEHLRARSEWQPGDRNSWSNLGTIYWHLGKYDSSAYCLEKSVALDPNDPITLEELSLAYSRSGQWNLVRAPLERLATLQELTVADLNMLGHSLVVTGAVDRADSVLSESLRRYPAQSEAHYYLGIVREQRAETSEAIAEYEVAMKSRSATEDLFVRGVRLYQLRQQWSEAERVALVWQSQFPRSAVARFMVAMCRISDGRYAEAQQALKQSLAIDSANALAHYYLATTYRHLNQPDEALAVARRAAELDSSLALPYLEMVYLAADAGDRATAVAATREYLRRAPADSGMGYLKQFMEP